jgi:hypothetical protein
MNDALISLLNGAGIGNILIPKNKEHEHIVGLLNKYKTETGVDLRKNTGGFSKQSGFIRRLMAENALKHQGQYKKPTFPLHPKSTMDKQAEFDYKKIANANQRGFNTSEYGASPFITKHFGSVKAVPFERKRGVPPPLEPYSKKRTSTKKTQETEQQKEARKEFEEPPTDVVRDVVPLPQGKRDITKENYDGYVDKYIESESDKLNFFQPEKGWSSDGGNAKWVGYYTKDNKFIKNNDYIIEPGINLKTIIVDYGRERFDNVLYIMTNKTYYIPTDECVLKKGDEIIEIQKIKIPSLNKYQDKFWCLYSPGKSVSFENRHRIINVEVITKKGTFIFSLESQLDLEQQINIGLQASLILYGPKKTYQQHDRKANYGFKREKLSKGNIKYETEVLRWYEDRKYDDMVLTINGKRYRMYDKGEKFPLWNREQFAEAEEE